MVVRRVALAGMAFVRCVLVLVAVAVPAAAGAAGGCAPTCGGGTASSVRGPAHPTPESCVRSASCGGGIALGLGMVAGIGMLAAAVPAIGASLLSRWRRRFRVRPLHGRSPSGGLFRPPRLLLDV
jgi:hypothetical protein